MVKKGSLKTSSSAGTAGQGFQRLFIKPKAEPADGMQSPQPAKELQPTAMGSVEEAKTKAVADPLAALSQDQLDRIAANRRRALERQQDKLSPSKFDTPETPVKSNFPNSTKTPERGSMNNLPITPDKCLTPKSLSSHLAQVSSLRLPIKAVIGCAGRFDGICHSWSQYNKTYAQRLDALREAVSVQARSLWSREVQPHAFLTEMSNFKLGVSQQIVMVGVLQKVLHNRPDIFEAYRRDPLVVGSLPEGKISTSQQLCGDTDELWLEDATMRVKLSLPHDRVSMLCSGLIVGVRGTTTVKGEFEAADLCFSDMPATPVPQHISSCSFVAFISGLMIGSGETQATTRAVEFLTRQGNEDDRNLSAGIEQLVICGGLLAGGDGAAWRPSKGTLAAADSLLTQLASHLPVDLMPGEHDPTNISLPQNSFLPHLFPQARGCGNLRFASNPHERTLGGLHVLGHSGQPVRDVLRCTNIADPLNALLTCFEALHIAPTAPETLAMPPALESDPFIISSVPHILFSGGHEQFQHEWRACAKSGSGTQCLCVPNFQKNPAIVLVNLGNPKDIRLKVFNE